MNAELGISSTQRPYGVWLLMYQEWLNFLDGIWPHYEDMFRQGTSFADTTFDTCWDDFFKKWVTLRKTAMGEWITYPLWRDRFGWYQLMNRWTRAVFQSRFILGNLINRDLILPEVWPDLDEWAGIFRPWWNHLCVWAEVVDQLHATTHGTAIWRRWEEMLETPVTWSHLATQPLEKLRRRVRSLGRDWSESARQGWLLWLHDAETWTLEWFSTWEAWFLLPLYG